MQIEDCQRFKPHHCKGMTEQGANSINLHQCSPSQIFHERTSTSASQVIGRKHARCIGSLPTVKSSVARKPVSFQQHDPWNTSPAHPLISKFTPVNCTTTDDRLRVLGRASTTRISSLPPIRSHVSPLPLAQFQQL